MNLASTPLRRREELIIFFLAVYNKFLSLSLLQREVYLQRLYTPKKLIPISNLTECVS